MAKDGMKGLALVLGMKPKGKGASSSDKEEEAPESSSDVESSSDEYKSIFVDAAKAGDWEAAFDAIKMCVGGEE